MRRYAPEPRPATSNAGTNASSSSDETIAPGTTLVVRELATGRDTTFGSVSEMAWQDKGSLLALAVTVEGGVGNGVQLFDSVNGTLRVLDSSASTYTGPRRGGRIRRRLAALRSQSNDAREGPTHVVLAWPDVTRTPAAARELDAGKSGLAGDLRVVRFRAPRWSEDGARIYVGVAPWPVKPARSEDREQSRRLVATSEQSPTNCLTCRCGTRKTRR